MSLRIAGYRRFEEARVNLDGHLIAIVGPNEAGKSSILDALAHLNERGEFGTGDPTRGITVAPDAEVIEARFLLGGDDLTSIADVPEAVSARWLIVGKRASGVMYTGLEPRPRRNREPRTKASGSIEAVQRSRWAKDRRGALDSADDADQILDALDTLHEVCGSNEETLAASGLASLKAAIDALADLPAPPSRLAQLLDELKSLVEHEEREHPHDVARGRVADRRPRFLLFDDNHRTLASEYDLATLDLDDPPGALGNLATIAGLDLFAIRTLSGHPDVAKRRTLLTMANRTLETVFADAWKQSRLSVQFDAEQTVLHVLVDDDGTGYTSIAERSDGFRAFVALFAFATLHSSSGRPVLLVDEAEGHLHYEAQADLVRVFTRQDRADVIYTTHSAGCLPEDLGSGIRSVSPVGTGRSLIANSIWTAGSTGMTPLLLAMGANSLAFTPTRRAVIVEGPSDAILLPTLLRDATGLPSLGYQMVPSLAEASTEALAELDFDAARVAYLVDGDDAGQQLRARLLEAGVPKERIFALADDDGRALVVEDLVDRDAYLQAANEELRRSNGDGFVLARDDVSDTNRPADVARWCADRGVSAPSKTHVAAHLLNLDRGGEQGVRSVGGAVIASIHRDLAARLHSRLSGALAIRQAAE